MKSIFKPLIVTAVLASSALWAQAQTPPAGERMHAHAMGAQGRMDPAKMQERMAARQAALKAKLSLSAAQEGAWNDYLAARQPPADRMAGKSLQERQKMRQDMQAMTTPERLDRMTAMKAERDARMTQRQQATRNFYSALTPEQQKVFDANTQMGAGQGTRGAKGGHRHG